MNINRPVIRMWRMLSGFMESCAKKTKYIHGVGFTHCFVCSVIYAEPNSENLNRNWCFILNILKQWFEIVWILCNSHIWLIIISACSLVDIDFMQSLNAQSRAMLMAKLDRSGIASRFVQCYYVISFEEHCFWAQIW